MKKILTIFSFLVFSTGIIFAQSPLEFKDGDGNNLMLIKDEGTTGTVLTDKIGVGTSTPISKLSVGGSGDLKYSIYGYSNSLDGIGVYGETSGADGFGVYGYGSDVNGNYNDGGHFVSEGNGSGVHGRAEGGGNGVYARANGTGNGIHGENYGTGLGAFGGAFNVGASGNHGGAFLSNGIDGNGVWAQANGSSGSGIYAEANGDGIGAVGIAHGNGNGIQAESHGSSAAIFAKAYDTGNFYNHGGYFESLGQQGHGIFAKGNGPNGNGIYAEAQGLDGQGVSGRAYGANGIGIFGEGTAFAGFFNGNLHVTGNITYDGNLNQATPSITMEHPLDPENSNLIHAGVHSSEMKNIYDGRTITNSGGEAVINLPDWFEAINKDFRYQLTVIGEFAQAIVSEEIDNGKFSIKTNKPNVKVSWQITGIRNDSFAKTNEFKIEREKNDTSIKNNHQKSNFLIELNNRIEKQNMAMQQIIAKNEQLIIQQKSKSKEMISKIKKMNK